MSIEIRPLHTGTVEVMGSHLFTDGTDEERYKLDVWSFYLHHVEKDEHCMFDLGIMKDLNKQPPKLVDIFSPTIPATAEEGLAARGIPPSSIKHIFLSHAHFDHCGDPGQFPNATCVYGAGTTAHACPAYPTNPESGFSELAFPAGRTRELMPAEYTCAVDGFAAAGVDYFGDGSLVLVPAPGHVPGHTAALCRTRKGRVLLGGDSCHHEDHLADHRPGGRMSETLHVDGATVRENLERIGRWMEVDGGKGKRLGLAHVGSYTEWEDFDVLE